MGKGQEAAGGLRASYKTRSRHSTTIGVCIRTKEPKRWTKAGKRGEIVVCEDMYVLVACDINLMCGRLRVPVLVVVEGKASQRPVEIADSVLVLSRRNKVLLARVPASSFWSRYRRLLSTGRARSGLECRRGRSITKE